MQFPIAYPDNRVAEEYVADLERRAVTWDMVDVGYSHSWEREVTWDAVAAYADAVDDHTEWYGPDKSPFGPPVAPPLLLSHWCIETIRPLGTAAGHVNTYHRSEILRPVPLGTHLRFNARVTDKWVKRGRRYRRDVIEVIDLSTNEVVFRETRDYMMGRAPEGEETV